MHTIQRLIASVACFALIALTGCGTAPTLGEVDDEAELLSTPGYKQVGMASYYGVGDGFHGRRTANGETFNAYGLTAAHRSLRFGTCLLVTNLSNQKSVRVRINDRGPYSGGRILDLSYGAAKAIGLASAGVGRVQLEAVSCTQTAAAE